MRSEPFYIQVYLSVLLLCACNHERHSTLINESTKIPFKQQFIFIINQSIIDIRRVIWFPVCGLTSCDAERKDSLEYKGLCTEGNEVYLTNLTQADAPRQCDRSKNPICYIKDLSADCTVLNR